MDEKVEKPEIRNIIRMEKMGWKMLSEGIFRFRSLNGRAKKKRDGTKTERQPATSSLGLLRLMEGEI